MNCPWCRSPVRVAYNSDTGEELMLNAAPSAPIAEGEAFVVLGTNTAVPIVPECRKRPLYRLHQATCPCWEVESELRRERLIHESRSSVAMRAIAPEKPAHPYTLFDVGGEPKRRRRR